jgi:hypothetical protein
MVKMAKLGPDKKPQGTPLMVRNTDIATKQKQGFFVIGESKQIVSEGSLKDFLGPFSANGLWVSDRRGNSVLEVTKHGSLAKEVANALNKVGGIGESTDKPKANVVHCSQCGKGFSAAGLKPPHHTGFSHCKDHKGMKVIAEDASGGASSAGGIASSMGNGTGFASGGIGMQKRKKKKFGEGFFGIDDSVKGKIQNIVSKLSDEPGNWDFRSQTFTDVGMQALKDTLNNNPKFIKYALGLTSKDYEESVEEGASEKEGQGPKFTGYWKGKDKGRPGKKMVGGD